MLPDLLVPPPQELERLPGALEISGQLGFHADGSFDRLGPALHHLEQVLSRFSIELARNGPASPALVVERGGQGLGSQGYRLQIDEQALRIEASDSAGAAYGIHTTTQWIAQHGDRNEPGARIPSVRVSDWPDLPHRGVLLDVSRSRVPTMDTLLGLVDLLSCWKINQLQLYIEHTFAYRGHEGVWQGSSPLTAAEIRALDAYCAQRHVELVPNQNSFGHLHRWLRHSAYRKLAECPDGIEHPFSAQAEPFSLCPTDPASLAFLEDLYDQLLPNFTSAQFHVGFDETFDLGVGRSRERVEAIGVDGVYLEFLQAVHRLASSRGRRLQFWGDIVAKHPQLVARIPSDAIVMSWGYEAGHPFSAEVEPLTKRGLEVYVCPGTSSWLSFAGRVDNALANIATAVTSAVDCGAVGCLVTDWGDRGHLQPLPVSYPGFVGGACFSWNAGLATTPESFPLEAVLRTHVFDSEPQGRAQGLIRLGNLYRSTGARAFNGSPLFHLLTAPELPLDHPRLDGLDAARLERCLEVIDEARAQIHGGKTTLVGREIDWIGGALELGTELGLARLRGGATESTSQVSRQDRLRLGGSLRQLIQTHEALWLERSRPGGVDESREVLERALDALETGSL